MTYHSIGALAATTAQTQAVTASNGVTFTKPTNDVPREADRYFGAIGRVRL